MIARSIVLPIVLRRVAWALFLVAGSLAFGACSPGTNGTGDLLDAGALPDQSRFMTAPHAPFPQITDNGGPRLANPQIVLATYPGYAYSDHVESLGRWLATSSWLTTVGSEYGVGAGAFVSHVLLPDTAPPTITDAQVQSLLVRRIGDHTLPAPPSMTNDYVYFLYLPASTSLVDYFGMSSCNVFRGYHRSVENASLRFAYAVIFDCPPFLGVPEVPAIEYTTSHELIEAATNAYGDEPAMFLTDATEPASYTGGEVGDLCIGEAIEDSGYLLTRVWSNAAAAAGKAPCVPSEASAAYFNVSPSPNEVLELPAGGSQQVTITGWSTAPLSDWNISPVALGGSFTAGATLADMTINNGRSTTLTITVPAQTPSGTFSLILLSSLPVGGAPGDGHGWPIAVITQ